MENKNLLIGAGVVVVGYLLWEKSQKDELNKRVQNLTKFADDSTKFTSEMGMKPHLGMPQVKAETPEEKKAFHDILVKMLPNEFTIKQSANSNVNYYKGNNQDFYKVGYSTTGFSGMMPIKISFAEYSNAYNEFKNQPK